MTQPVHILIVDGEHDPAFWTSRKSSITYQVVICLFWSTPTTEIEVFNALQAHCIGLHQLIKEMAVWEKRAYDLMQQMLELSVSSNTEWGRNYLDEPLYYEALDLTLLDILATFIQEHYCDPHHAPLMIDCALSGKRSEYLRAFLSNHISVEQFSVRLLFQEATIERQNLWGRLQKRVDEAKLTGNWSTQYYNFLIWLDKTYYWHCQTGNLLPQPSVSEDNITFFSSYSNNTKTLAAFQNLMTGPVEWLTVNATASQGLPPNVRSKLLWQFSDKTIRRSATNRHSEEAKSVKDATLQLWLNNSPTLRSWYRIEKTLLTNLTQCWEIYLEKTRPRLVVMANQWSIEGWFTHVAHRRGIPVLQIMHGVRSDYLYTKTPITSKYMIVWGNFWRQLWPSEEQSKIVVYNPNKVHLPSKTDLNASKRHLAYFSWPLNLQLYFDENELLAQLSQLFNRLLMDNSCDITIRFHPRENPDDFVAFWKKRFGTLPANLRLSKSESLTEVLQRTDLAVMYHSTVMLDCLIRHIPIIIPGWIDFGLNAALTTIPAIHLAQDWNDLGETLKRWVERPPEMPTTATEQVISPMGLHRAEIEALIQQMLKNGTVADGNEK